MRRLYVSRLQDVQSMSAKERLAAAASGGGTWRRRFDLPLSTAPAAELVDSHTSNTAPELAAEPASGGLNPAAMPAATESAIVSELDAASFRAAEGSR